MKSKTIFVAGHRGLAGGAILRELQAHGYTNLVTRTRAEVDLQQREAVRAFFRGSASAGRGGRGGEGRRDQGEQRFPRRVPAREPEDPKQPHRGGARFRRGEAALPRQLLHLPEIRAAADPGRRAADRRAGADERGLRHREDRRHQALPGLRAGVRAQFHQRDADESLRPGRQLRSATIRTCCPRCCAKCTRRKNRGAREVSVWGTGTPRREFLHVDDLAQRLPLSCSKTTIRRRSSTSATARM